MAKGVLRVKILGDVSHLQKALGGLTKGMGGFAAKAALAGAALGGLVIGKSISNFMKFDDAMAQSLAIMGDVSDEMRTKMGEAAREVGMTTRKSATDAAQSYYYLASAGYDAAQSMEAMPLVAKFAQAGMFDMALATDLLTDAQSALGLSSENLAEVSDVLVKANTLANASVEQFSKSLTTKAGAAMKSVGMQLEEGVAVLAAFADQGIKGEEAGTQFGIVLRDLQTKALENEEAFEQFNVQVFDAEGELSNMADIVGGLEKALGGMSDKQKKATLSTMGFTDRSIASLLALMGTSDAIRDYQEALEDAAGTTQEVSDKQLESLAGKWDLIKGKLEEAGMALAEKMMPYLEGAADWVDKNMPAIIDAFMKMGAAIAWVIEKLEYMWRVLSGNTGIEHLTTTELSTGLALQGRSAAEIQQILDALGRTGNQPIGDFLTGQHGGLVPGSGPVPLTAHGGEYILTEGDTAMMQALIGSVGSGGSATVAAINGLRRDVRRGTGAVWTRPTPLGAWGVL